MMQSLDASNNCVRLFCYCSDIVAFLICLIVSLLVKLVEEAFQHTAK